MSSIDDVIRQRLDKLKENNPSASASTTSPIVRIVKKTDAEQVQSLLTQLSEETSLDEKSQFRSADIDSQIKSRLVRLKSREGCDFPPAKPSSRPKQPTPEPIEDKEFFENCSCSKLLADLEISKDVDSNYSDESDTAESTCVICYENKPSLVCLGCDKDPYCSSCFKEFHSDDDDHKTVPYVKKT